MLWKRTTVMLGAFAASLVLVAVATLNNATGGGPTFDWPDVDAGEITRIEISGIDNAVTLERVETGWVVMPGGYGADEKTVERATKEIADLGTGSLISTNPSHFGTYEVGEAGMKVAVSSAVGALPVLRLGKETTDNRGHYIRRADAERVFVTAGRIRGTLDKEIKFWRNREILAFDKEKATALAVSGPSVIMAFTRGAEGWAFDPPPEGIPDHYRLDASKIDSLVRSLARLSAFDFVDDVEDLADLGLDPPEIKAIIRLDEGEPLEIGVGAESEGRYFCRAADNDQVFLINGYQRNQLARDPKELQDLKINAFDAALARRIEVRSAGKVTGFALGEAGGDWILESTDEGVPPGFKLDPQKVSGLVSSIAGLRGDSCLGYADQAGLGLTSPSQEVLVGLSDGVTKGIRFGRDAAEGEIYTAGDDGLVYQVKNHVVDRIAGGIDRYKVSQGASTPAYTPDMLKNLPPEVREQLMQKQRQEIMQRQMMQQLMQRGGQ